MLGREIINSIKKDDDQFYLVNKRDFILPLYDPSSHYIEITKSGYFRALTIVRHHIRQSSDYYFSQECNAKNIDLFMLTPSVSSPLGPGSDSEAIQIKFGNLNTYLVDSSQFGFEPVLLNGFDKVYCYLPSMRGENPDKRHLNQFFHCEAEIKGTLEDLIPLVEEYIRTLCKTIISMPNIIDLISVNPEMTKIILTKVIEKDFFQRITLDEAINLLIENNKTDFFIETSFGRDITSAGEIEVMKLLSSVTPVWITNYDRDRVPFYQKPDPNNTNKVMNADLIFPPIIDGSFGGEIVGCGQRQDTVSEMYDSLTRQKISPESYEWYINLRRLPEYSATSGFGIGIERFIAWAFGRDDIKDVILYPRLKNVVSYP